MKYFATPSMKLVWGKGSPGFETVDDGVDNWVFTARPENPDLRYVQTKTVQTIAGMRKVPKSRFGDMCILATLTQVVRTNGGKIKQPGMLDARCQTQEMKLSKIRERINIYENHHWEWYSWDKHKNYNNCTRGSRIFCQNLALTDNQQGTWFAWWIT